MIRSSFSNSFQRKLQLQLYRESDVGEWWLMIGFELDIPSLTSEGMQLRNTYSFGMMKNENSFNEVNVLSSSSMIDWLIMIEMLMLLNTTSFSTVTLLLLNAHCPYIHQHSGYQESIKWRRYLLLLNPLWFKAE